MCLGVAWAPCLFTTLDGIKEVVGNSTAGPLNIEFGRYRKLQRTWESHVHRRPPREKKPIPTRYEAVSLAATRFGTEGGLSSTRGVMGMTEIKVSTLSGPHPPPLQNKIGPVSIHTEQHRLEKKMKGK